MGAPRGSVLAIGLLPDDAQSLHAVAGRRGLEVRGVGGLTEGLSAIAGGRWMATLLSLELTGSDLDLAARIAGEKSAGEVAVITAKPSAAEAMAATRMGIREVFTTPLEADRLDAFFEAAAGPEGRVPLPEPSLETEGVLVGSSPGLLEAFKVVGRVAASPATVLITGESGTGKEVVAQAIHQSSDRERNAFVAVNCAAIPEDLLESELFGHERGAFTGAIARKVGRFERANGGTLFLDEIGDMSLVLQAKILRALQEREIERLGGEERIRIDVRVVAATHRDLSALIESGDFREDLFYRLAVVRLHLQALRDRGTDLRELALHFAARFAIDYGRPLRYVEVDGLRRLEEHDWPGNVRELRNVVERAVLVSGGDTLRAEDLQVDASVRRRVPGAALPGYAPTLSLAEVEKLHIRRVLEEVDGQLGRAAEVLGVHRNTVSRKAQEYGLLP